MPFVFGRGTRSALLGYHFAMPVCFDIASANQFVPSNMRQNFPIAFRLGNTFVIFFVITFVITSAL